MVEKTKLKKIWDKAGSAIGALLLIAVVGPPVAAFIGLLVGLAIRTWAWALGG